MLSSSHWGIFRPIVRDGRLVAAEPFAADPDPSQLLQSIPSAIHHKSRVLRPAVRKSWLESGPGAHPERRGSDRYVEVDWDQALDLVAGELKRVVTGFGNQAIYGGSYGWASAGRFHHAKSQVRRFLNVLGGFTDSVDTYSNAAGTVIARRILGTIQAIDGPGTSWSSIAANAGLVVMFGGMPLRNTQITVGGLGEHTSRDGLEKAKAAGVAFVNVCPIRDDAAAFLDAEWLAPRPGSDTAIMLGLIHTLISEGLHDREFLASHATGFERFADYVMGVTDGVPKTAQWASGLSELPAEAICALARRMAATRTFLVVNWSLQRSEHGEQPFWAAIALAAALGQLGLPGGGLGFGYGSLEGLGGQRRAAPRPTFPTLRNPVEAFIPVARIADMLLSPGAPFQYDGRDLAYPDIRLVYWCGGNPFHHHQDLNRLIAAWRRPEAVIVHETWWTATARHADVVLPASSPLERDDIGASSLDRFMVAMRKAIEPLGEARSDFAIFGGLAERLGLGAAFHEGRGEGEWLRLMYQGARERAAQADMQWPDFDAFWDQGFVEIPAAEKPYVLFEAFRKDPALHRLGTPSGHIEIVSEAIAGFAYEDCLGHPTWMAPREWLGSPLAARFPLHLLTTQPATRLHGQMDMGTVSQASKVAGREPMRINPADAAARGVGDGDIVRVFNDRGAILAGAVLTDSIRPGVIQIATGAWYDPETPGEIGSLDKHGNPNVLTPDRGTSKLAQGPSAQNTLVEVARFEGAVPRVSAFDPPIDS
ncbi:Asp-tRNA(Asn)/Glu-tRNA(Gln) amidotransferase GatCAB subunit C [Mesorhizobium sanjuanii]|uniref:Asp-tRNA(Asn)/Glu-tRNA(Gln) amidotransferase GatCAB subunit C n=1 Tax=Mesorhizobium sanjuanii TaxID=2037900 RepID=A0A2A6FMC3_9HYPH|nr:molybdopterin-dependent oxidoreductase [Mesorhizobium sanjuanii]PDQ22816.1 Asp-tRNA(Asn)/Glu-tRNA(Gln) amidotransferase GatCAB subunit C [Mesorhizobium sanjuanii]